MATPFLSENKVPIELPVIDMGQPTHILVEQIGKACRDIGAFQVVNHGVPDSLMAEAMEVVKEFFALPYEDKAHLYDEHGQPAGVEAIFGTKAKLYAARYTNAEGEIVKWKDCLGHGIYEELNEELLSSWPNKPARYKEVIGKYSLEVRKLAVKVFNIIGQSLGLPLGYFEKECMDTQALFHNSYPAYANPSARLGVKDHVDPTLINFLQQDSLGLQCLNENGQWADVKYIPNAFAVVLGMTINVMTNDMIKGAPHRALGQTYARNTIITFFSPSKSAIVGPAKQLISEKSPPLYMPFKYVEFYENFLTASSGYFGGLKPYRI